MTEYRRVQRDSLKENFISQLMEGEFPLFKEYWRLITFCALLGHQTGRRTPIANAESGKAIPISAFNNLPTWPGLLHLMMLVDSVSHDALFSNKERNDEKIKAFEEYANTGLEILSENLFNRHNKVDLLIDLIDEHIHDKNVCDVNLSEITI